MRALINETKQQNNTTKKIGKKDKTFIFWKDSINIKNELLRTQTANFLVNLSLNVLSLILLNDKTNNQKIAIKLAEFFWKHLV